MTPPAKRPKRGHGYRPPDQIVDQRISEAAAVLALKPSIHRCELHKMFATRWLRDDGLPVHWRTIENYIVRARKHLNERSRRPKDAWIDDLLAGYDRDIADADSKTRMAARQGIRQMLGLDAPARQELSGPNGTPLPGGNGVVIIAWPHETSNGNGNGHDVIEVKATKQIADAPEKDN